MPVNNDFPTVRALLKQSSVHRYLSSRLIQFADEERVLELMKNLQRFPIKDVPEIFNRNLGYKIHDRTRIRMVKALIDFFVEFKYLKNYEGHYIWDGEAKKYQELRDDENKLVEALFKGQISFIEKCIGYAGEFLRGEPSLYGFNNNSKYIWEEFLGDAEFIYARSLLIRLLFSGRDKNCNVLVLCYGPGFDIMQIQELLPDVQVTALDYQDLFYEQASRRIVNADSIRWVESETWGGFGTPLPFEDNTLDCVFFACADPYIPEDVREYVYRDIFRVLKQRGSVGILTRSYPDAERMYVKDTWTRIGVLYHDFSESICKGWQGFRDAHESINIFKSIGYDIHTIMLNASMWRLDKK